MLSLIFRNLIIVVTSDPYAGLQWYFYLQSEVKTVMFWQRVHVQEMTPLEPMSALQSGKPSDSKSVPLLEMYVHLKL
jgi:hypothetical protein